MEFGKLFAVNIEFKEINSLRTDNNLVIDVVLIAKNHQFLQPLLYELKHQALMGLALGSYPQFAEDIFPSECTLIGEVMSLKRKSKQVVLSNRTLVYYQHLILVTHENQSVCKEEEFASAFQALVSALRVQAQKASVMQAAQQSTEKAKEIQRPIYYSEGLPEGSAKMPYPKNNPENNLGLRSNKRLYELYLGN